VSSEHVERKLAAILAADVVGYSRLTGTDEEGTMRRLRALRAELIDPVSQTNRGRVFHTAGASILIEFASVVDAVRCSVEIQRGIVVRTADFVAEKQIEFRIGIHLGDVMVQPDGDLLGDGVNIAPRLEGIAEPGGIYLSEDAWRQVRDKMPEPFTDLGEQILAPKFAVGERDREGVELGSRCAARRGRRSGRPRRRARDRPRSVLRAVS
jgi:adenylate cyclase